jgi:hypothetical protein
MRIGIGLASLVAAVAALALAALHVASPSGASRLRGSGVCGGDRWHVRTLQDRPKLLPDHTTTLRKLGQLRRPSSISQTRMPIERQIVTLHVGALVVDREANGDFRVMLVDRQSNVRELWAFAPHPFCNSGATNYRRHQMGIARQRLLKAYEASCGVTQVTGVLFFSTRPKTLRERLVQLRPILGVETGCS